MYKHIKAGDDSILPPGFKCSDFIAKSKFGRKLGKIFFFSCLTFLVVLGDTSDPAYTIPKGKNCDVLVHESTFLDDKQEALAKSHSTAGRG